MELNKFISETLKEIISGVKEAQGNLISPPRIPIMAFQQLEKNKYDKSYGGDEGDYA